jgi:heptosyltransferase-2
LIEKDKILVIQTAFLGDVILALPVVQALKTFLPESKADFLCIPATADVLENNPDINKVIVYDKKGADKIDKFIEMLSEVREEEYDIVICPHRSFRSAMLTYYSEAKTRIGFDKNSFSGLLTHKVHYVQSEHEVLRNLELVKAVPGIEYDQTKISLQPKLYPSQDDINIVNHLFNKSNLISFAPCSKWFTKQLTMGKSIEIVNKLITEGYNVALVGGAADEDYGFDLQTHIHDDALINLAGKLTPLQSYVVMTKSKAVITVDSASQHLAAAAGVPVVLIYGSTNSSFGFYPLTSKNVIIENNQLNCRPCTDHGRDSCPLGHFKCIEDLSMSDAVIEMDKLIKG